MKRFTVCLELNWDQGSRSSCFHPHQRAITMFTSAQTNCNKPQSDFKQNKHCRCKTVLSLKLTKSERKKAKNAFSDRPLMRRGHAQMTLSVQLIRLTNAPNVRTSNFQHTVILLLCWITLNNKGRYMPHTGNHHKPQESKLLRLTQYLKHR